MHDFHVSQVFFISSLFFLLFIAPRKLTFDCCAHKFVFVLHVFIVRVNSRICNQRIVPQMSL